jgi:hypothetical protein
MRTPKWQSKNCFSNVCAYLTADSIEKQRTTKKGDIMSYNLLQFIELSAIAVSVFWMLVGLGISYKIQMQPYSSIKDRKAEHEFVFNTSMPSSCAFNCILKFSMMSHYAVEHFDESTNYIVLSEKPDIFSYGAYYLISVCIKNHIDRNTY